MCSMFSDWIKSEQVLLFIRNVYGHDILSMFDNQQISSTSLELWPLIQQKMLK